MSIFKYTLPSGAQYIVEGPSGATQEQADYIFYNQVAAGSLVGYTKGQTLSSIQTQLTKFELSRLDRGTAGVDLATILAIISAPVYASIPLNSIPLQNPITAADIAGTPITTGIGPLSPEQVQAINAQIANLVDQLPDEYSVDTGIGEYGITVPALEEAGYLKPGTSSYPDTNCVIGTPSVWTGKNGVTSLTSVLGDSQLQAQIQTEILQNGYNSLTATGTIQTAPTQPASLTTGQVYTSTGLSTLTAATLLTGTAALTGNLNNAVTKAFAGASNISSLLSNPVENISTIASGAVNSVTQSIANLPGTAITAANNLVSSALNSVNGAVGGLIANASQFGAPVTALWAQGSGALNSALSISTSASNLANTLGATGLASNITGLASGVSGLASGALSAATGAISGAVGELTSMASTALSGVQSQAQELLASLGGNLDIFGKMSSFSIDFSLFSSDSLVSATKVAAGFSNTVNRNTVDAAVTRILGNPKIPAPTFEYPSLASLGSALDISFAKNALQSLTGVASQIQGTVAQAQQLATNVQSTVNRIV